LNNIDLISHNLNNVKYCKLFLFLKFYNILHYSISKEQVVIIRFLDEKRDLVEQQ